MNAKRLCGWIAGTALAGAMIAVPGPAGVGRALAQIYRWVDEQGQAHVADNPNDIPPRFRSPRPPAAPAPSSSATPMPPASDPEVQARDRELRAQGNQVRTYLDMSTARLVSATPTRGRSLEEWRSDLRYPSPQARSNAAEALRYFGSQAVPALVPVLRDPDAGVRLGALVALASIGPGARSAGPEIARLLGDPEPNVRVSAAVAVLRWGIHVKEAVRALDTGVPRPGDKKEMWTTTQEMLQVLIIPPSAVPVLVEVLRDRDPQMRVWAAYALHQVRRSDWPDLRDPWSGLGPGGPSLSVDAVAALTQALKDPDVEVQKAAADNLKWIGHDATSARPALVEAFKDSRGAARADCSTL